MNKLIPAILILLSTTSCSSLKSAKESVAETMPWYRANAVREIGLFVKDDKNLNHAVSVDIVFIYDENLQSLLENVSAQQWFNEKPGYLSSYAHLMDIVHREMVPGYNDRLEPMPKNYKDALSVVAFARYPQDPNAKAVLTEQETPWLIFSNDSMQLLTQAPAGLSGGQ